MEILYHVKYHVKIYVICEVEHNIIGLTMPSLLSQPRNPGELNRFAVVVCVRNESETGAGLAETGEGYRQMTNPESGVPHDTITQTIH